MLTRQYASQLRLRLRPQPRRVPPLSSPACFSRGGVRRRHEQVAVPCEKGAITLDIHHPSPAYQSNPDHAQAAILHLPDPSAATSQATPSHLAATARVPTIQVNYRVDRAHRFPLPLHDVLTCYDWVVSNILSPPTPSPHSTSQSGVLLHATSPVSSSLALAIALTECRLSTASANPARVLAVSARNAVVDWVSPFLSLERDTAEGAEDPEGLGTLREAYFHPRRLGDTFDPFASPILFFRTAGVDVGSLTGGAGHEGHGLSSAREENFGLGGNAMDALDDSGYDSLASTVASAPASKPVAKLKLRKYHRRFPPVLMGPTLLPAVRLSIGDGASPVLRAQAEEFVKVMRRAVVRQGLPARGDRGREGSGGEGQDEVDMEAEDAERKERAREMELWAEGRVWVADADAGDGNGEEGGDVEEVREAQMAGEWFREVLEREEASRS